MSAAGIAAEYPQGVRELADGGRYHTLAGQPTDDSEMALTLARSLIKNKIFVKEEVLSDYREWLQTRPLDVEDCALSRAIREGDPRRARRPRGRVDAALPIERAPR